MEILSSATKWIKLESIILSGISQTEKDKYHRWYPVICDIKANLTETESSDDYQVQEWGKEWQDIDQREQTYKYKMNKFWGSNREHGENH